MASTIANLDFGIGQDGHNSMLRFAVEGYHKKCAIAMSKAAHSLAQGQDMKGLLRAATDIDNYHKTLEDISKICRTMLLGGESAAATLSTAIKDTLVVFEDECASAWLDQYAKTRPGGRIVRRASGTNMTGWHAINPLRLTLEGPQRTYHVYDC
jgi:hypothetical protein